MSVSLCHTYTHTTSSVISLFTYSTDRLILFLFVWFSPFLFISNMDILFEYVKHLHEMWEVILWNLVFFSFSLMMFWSLDIPDL